MVLLLIIRIFAPMNSKMTPNANRIIQFDVLRIIAALAVVLLHVSGQGFYDCYPSAEWDARNFYNALVSWPVPIFVMISGALFLDSRKQLDIKTLYTKNVTRVLIVFIAWSIIYAAYGGIGEKGVIGLVGRMIQGPIHFWFLKMLLGLYVAVPILRAIVANRKLEEYFICLSLITAFFIPMLFPLIGYISDLASNYAEITFDEFGIRIASGYVGYFVLGHYLKENVLNDTVKKVIYCLGILSVFPVYFLTDIITNRVGEPYLFLCGKINMFTLFEALALFIFIKDIQIASRYHQVLISVSKLSLGIYIVHPLVMSIVFDLWGINSASWNPVCFIPVYAFLIFVASYVIVLVLSKIPFVKKIVM